MPSITRVYETILYAPELEAVEAFYAGVLGLEPLPRNGDRGAVFRVNDESVLIVFDALKTRAPHEQVPSHRATGEGHTDVGEGDADGSHGDNPPLCPNVSGHERVVHG